MSNTVGNLPTLATTYWPSLASALCALICFGLYVEADRTRDRRMASRLGFSLLFLVAAFGPLAVNWVQSQRQEQITQHWRTVALEVERRNHVALLKDDASDRIAAAMKPYSDVPVFLQCLPGTTESFCKPALATLRRSMSHVSVDYNVSLWAGGLDAQPPPPAPHGIEILSPKGATPEAANVLNRTLAAEGFDVGQDNVDMTGSIPKGSHTLVVVRVYDP